MELKSEKVKLESLKDEIGWHVWQKNNKETTATNNGPLVIVYHGFLAHGRYPTVRYACELCLASFPGATVVAPDMPGHGISDGPRGYLGPGNAPALISNFGQAVLQRAREKYDDSSNKNKKKRKVFLVGSSMGGTIALQVALREPPNTIAGVVLLAPMLKLKVSAVEEAALGWLAMLVPEWHLIPSSSTNSEKQYRDVIKRAECDNDPLTVKGSKIRVGSALTCVQLARTALSGGTDSSDDNDNSNFTKFPVWIGVADEDVVVDKQGCFDLHEKIQNAANGGLSTIAVYKALHGLLCEPSPLFDEITNDMVTWIKAQL